MRIGRLCAYPDRVEESPGGTERERRRGRDARMQLDARAQGQEPDALHQDIPAAAGDLAEAEPPVRVRARRLRQPGQTYVGVRQRMTRHIGDEAREVCLAARCGR